VDSKLDSRSKGRGFQSCLIIYELDGNGVKTMPCRLKYPILVHSIIEKRENTDGQMGHTKKNKKKTISDLYTLITLSGFYCQPNFGMKFEINKYSNEYRVKPSTS
jgi:hypothetical protein